MKTKSFTDTELSMILSEAATHFGNVWRPGYFLPDKIARHLLRQRFDYMPLDPDEILKELA